MAKENNELNLTELEKDEIKHLDSGGQKFGSDSAYSILDTIEKAFIDLGFSITDALDDLPVGYLWIEEDKQ